MLGQMAQPGKTILYVKAPELQQSYWLVGDHR